MPADLAAFAAAARSLAEATDRLDSAARPLGLAPAETCGWHETLHGKLVPQSGGGAHLICAVVGGTKHRQVRRLQPPRRGEGLRQQPDRPAAPSTPTCLVPRGFAGEARPIRDVSRVRAGPADGREPHRRADRRRPGPAVLGGVRRRPRRTCWVLDTPDVDSDAPRQLGAGREGAGRPPTCCWRSSRSRNTTTRPSCGSSGRRGDADAAVVVVFNQLDLPEDEAYWPEQVGTFCERTGVRPELVFLAPRDREAANALTLPFHERAWPPGGEVPKEARERGGALQAAGGAALRRGQAADAAGGRLARVADAETGIPAWAGRAWGTGPGSSTGPASTCWRRSPTARRRGRRCRAGRW